MKVKTKFRILLVVTTLAIFGMVGAFAIDQIRKAQKIEDRFLHIEDRLDVLEGVSSIRDTSYNQTDYKATGFSTKRDSTNEEKSDMLSEVLDKVRQEQAKRDRSFATQLAEFEKRAELAEDWKKTYLMPKLRKADVGDYKDWLKGFLKVGNKPTHVYNYEFSRWAWYVARDNLEMKPLYGSQAVHIIIPKDIEVTGNSGHTGLYFMKDFSCNGSVPIFKDIQF